MSFMEKDHWNTRKKRIQGEFKRYLNIISKYKVNIEYFEFLGKVCTYYGYSLDNLKEKLISDKEKRNMWGNKDE